MMKYALPCVAAILIAGAIGQHFGRSEPMSVAAFISAGVFCLWVCVEAAKSGALDA
jgi:sulfite exporter TauE/SafE